MNSSETQYFKEKLELIIRDLSMYTPEELARQLVRYAYVADGTEANAESVHQNCVLQSCLGE